MKYDPGKAGWAPIAITAALSVDMTTETAQAYKRLETPKARFELLRVAFGQGRAELLSRDSETWRVADGQPPKPWSSDA